MTRHQIKLKGVKLCSRFQTCSDQPCFCVCVCVFSWLQTGVCHETESASQSSQLLFLFISFASICCRCTLGVFRTECLLRGLPGIGRVPACRRRVEPVAPIMWAGLLSAERLLCIKLLPGWGYCSVSRVEEEK